MAKAGVVSAARYCAAAGSYFILGIGQTACAGAVVFTSAPRMLARSSIATPVRCKTTKPLKTMRAALLRTQKVANAIWRAHQPLYDDPGA